MAKADNGVHARSVKRWLDCQRWETTIHASQEGVEAERKTEERKKGGKKETARERETHIHTHTERERERQREETARENERETERERERNRERKRQRDREQRKTEESER